MFSSLEMNDKEHLDGNFVFIDPINFKRFVPLLLTLYDPSDPLLPQPIRGGSQTSTGHGGFYIFGWHLRSQRRRGRTRDGTHAWQCGHTRSGTGTREESIVGPYGSSCVFVTLWKFLCFSHLFWFSVCILGKEIQSLGPDVEKIGQPIFT